MKTTGKDIIKIIKPTDYIQKGSIAYKVHQDAVFIYTASCPPGIIDIYFVLLPKFMPYPGYLYLTYGDRLYYRFRDLGALYKEDTEEKIRRWCESAKKHILEQQLQVRSLTTIDNIYEYFTHYTNDNILFFITPEQHLEILIYCNYFMRRFDEMKDKIMQYKKELIEDRYYSEQITEMKLQRMDQMLRAYENENTYEKMKYTIRSSIPEIWR